VSPVTGDGEVIISSLDGPVQMINNSRASESRVSSLESRMSESDRIIRLDPTEFDQMNPTISCSIDQFAGRVGKSQIVSGCLTGENSIEL
jgi:hypothetical protein